MRWEIESPWANGCPGGAIDLTKPGNDYRVLQPLAVMDPNRNRSQAVFDALGMVAGTAVHG